jgi:hypothetical protein
MQADESVMPDERHRGGDHAPPGADRDIVTPLHKRIEKRYENISLLISGNLSR